MASAAVKADEKGQVSFEAQGKQFRLCFSINAMIEAEAAFGGRNITQIGLMLSGGANAQKVREQFGLALAGDPTIDAEHVLDVIAPAIEFAAVASVLPGDGASLGSLRTLFRCGLIDSQPDITDALAGELMNDMGLERAGQVIAVAFNAAQTKKGGKRPSKAS